jgi:DNA-binding HxlR family transcriptional regulator
VVAYDVFLADCPARTTLDLVADTWSVIPVVALDRGPARYSELQERIEGISKKMLTQTLHKLEAGGLVERRVLRTAPPGVEYRLSALGRTLLEPVRSLSRWAEEHPTTCWRLRIGLPRLRVGGCRAPIGSPRVCSVSGIGSARVGGSRCGSGG